MTREYPPDVYGGAGVHVTQLVEQLAKLVEVDVHCFGGKREGAVAYQPWEALGKNLARTCRRPTYEFAERENQDDVATRTRQIGDHALVAAMDASRGLLALWTWHTGKVTRNADHEFVGAWINGVNRNSSGKVKH